MSTDRARELFDSELRKRFKRLSHKQQQELWYEAKLDPSRMEDLLISLLPAVISAVGRKLRSKGFRLAEEDFMDVLQESTLGALRAIQSWDPQHESVTNLRNWVIQYVSLPLMRNVYGIVDNLSHESLTEAFTIGREFTDDDGEDVDWDSTPAELLTTSEVDEEAERARITRAVLRLDPQDREVLVLTYWHDLSLREIAERLGISHTTASRRLEVATAMLQNQLHQP